MTESYSGEPLDNPINDLSGVEGALIGNLYAFNAEGGFEMERGFATIHLREQEAPVYVDVTGSIQITMGVDVLNNKLNLADYEVGVGGFDTVTDKFWKVDPSGGADLENDEIVIDANTFVANLTDPEQIISLGNYSTLYSDFTAYVQQYFGNTGGFETLFAAASEFGIDGSRTDVSINTFDGQSFIDLLTEVPEADVSGEYVGALSGAITISNVTSLLRYAIDANTFGNRDPSDNNWGLQNGFVAGDLIWVPAGTTITLKLAIDLESFAPLNNRIKRETAETVEEGELFSTTTEATQDLITRVAKAPLLIKLVA